MTTTRPLVSSFSTWGNLYKKERDYVAAERVYLQVLQLMQAHLGHIHPEVAMCQNALADVLVTTNRHTEALPLLLQSMKVWDLWKTVQKSDHPESAYTLRLLAEVFHAIPDVHACEQAYIRLIGIQRRLLGESDPGSGRQPQ